MPKPKYKRAGYKMVDRDIIHFIDVYGEVISVYNKLDYNNILVWNSVINQTKLYPLGAEIVYYDELVMSEVNRRLGDYDLNDLVKL